MFKKKIYCCYSISLRNFLTKKGVRYEIAALNPNSKKLFWVYIKDKNLDKALNDWAIAK